MLPHAPGVQMQAIPEDAVQEDSGDEEEDDPNKRISSKNLSNSHSFLGTVDVFNLTVSSVDVKSVLMTRG